MHEADSSFSFSVLESPDNLKKVMTLESQIWIGESPVLDNFLRAAFNIRALVIGIFEKQIIVGK
jgi:hypothetical protein